MPFTLLLSPELAGGEVGLLLRGLLGGGAGLGDDEGDSPPPQANNKTSKQPKPETRGHTDNFMFISPTAEDLCHVFH